MEKMEHMDPQRCDRIWQRVSPELDPYPEVRAACREPSREPRTENIPERTGAAAVPAAPEIPAAPAESGCCLAGRAMGSIRLIQDFIEDELATGGPIWPMPPAPLMWLPAACCGSWQGRRGATPAVSWGCTIW